MLTHGDKELWKRIISGNFMYLYSFNLNGVFLVVNIYELSFSISATSATLVIKR